MEREVTVDALQLVRDDGYVLIQAGSWSKDKGFHAMGYLPGGKRTVRMTSDKFMDDFLRERLGWLPKVIITSFHRTTELEDSYRYGLPSKYVKTVHYAKLDHKKAGHTPMGFQVPLYLDTADESSDSDNESDSTWQKQLAEHQIFAVVQESCDLFVWLPPDLFEVLESPDVKPKIKPWIVRSKASVESFMENYMLLQRSGMGKRRNMRYNKLDRPVVNSRRPPPVNSRRRVPQEFDSDEDCDVDTPDD